ncbi:MAG: hypothetical protein KDC44_03655 [Phaeodactylibacter sp.]|nr:hypothetical protein [Phaeodactylibacter sp.]
MKKIIAIICCCMPFLMQAQSEAQVQTHMAAAETARAGGNLEETRFQLQEALVELDKVIGQKILAALPTQIKDLKADTGQDQYTSIYTGMSGLFVERTYTSTSDPSKKLRLTLMNDSPALASLMKMMNNSFMASMAGMEIIRLDGYKAVVEEVEGSDPLVVNINLPFDDSLLTLECTKCADQKEATDLATEFPVKTIIEIAQ